MLDTGQRARLGLTAKLDHVLDRRKREQVIECDAFDADVSLEAERLAAHFGIRPCLEQLVGDEILDPFVRYQQEVQPNFPGMRAE
jgi:hypothetical protein